MSSLFRLILLFCIAFFSCSDNGALINNGEKQEAEQDTLPLSVVKVLINNVQKDSLFWEYDSSICESVSNIKIYLSDYPFMRYSHLCNMISFVSSSNRFTCYPCLKIPSCSNDFDSLSHLNIEKIIDTFQTYTEEDSMSEQFGNIVEKYDTTSRIGIKLIYNSESGNDTGSAEIGIRDMFKNEMSDSTELDTTLYLFW